jgi:hypothetical protein
MPFASASRNTTTDEPATMPDRMNASVCVTTARPHYRRCPPMPVCQELQHEHDPRRRARMLFPKYSTGSGHLARVIAAKALMKSQNVVPSESTWL